MTHFIRLTSHRGTPIYIRRERVLMIEGFTFSERSECPGHVGSRLTLSNSAQWTESAEVREQPEQVLKIMAGPLP